MSYKFKQPKFKIGQEVYVINFIEDSNISYFVVKPVVFEISAIHGDFYIEIDDLIYPHYTYKFKNYEDEEKEHRVFSSYKEAEKEAERLNRS